MQLYTPKIRFCPDEKNFLPAPADGVPLQKKRMLRLLFSAVLIITGFQSLAQPDTSLHARLIRFMDASQLKNIDTVLHYTYPKLFSLAPAEQMKEVMEQAFDNEEIHMEMDSLQLGKIHPQITTDSGKYVKADYSMVIRMKLKNPPADSASYAQMRTLIMSGLDEKYGEGSSRFDAVADKIIIFTKTALVAIIDSWSPEWTFINFNKEEAFISYLLDDELVEKLSAQQ